MNDTPLNSERLIFTRFTSNQLEDYKKLVMSDEVMKYIFGKGIGEDEANKKFDEVLETNRTMPDIGYYYLTDKYNGAYIGLSKLVYFKYEQEEKNTEVIIAEVGYLLLPEFWGKGYASEITERLIRRANEFNEIKELVGIVYPQNTASVNVLAKNGFTLHEKDYYRGIIAEYYKLKIN